MTEPWSDATALVVGFVSGFGPCALTRGATLGAMVGGRSRRGVAVAATAYCAGSAAAFGAYGCVAGFGLAALALSPFAYGALAAVLLVAGISTLTRPTERHDHGRAGAFGSAGLLGFAGSLALSPCCTPFIAAIGAMGRGDLRLTAEMLALFGVGHVVPGITVALLTGSDAATRAMRPAFRSVLSFISGTASLGMAAYYGILA